MIRMLVTWTTRIVLVVALAAFSQAVGARTLKVNTNNVPDSVEDISLKKFKEIVESRTNGGLEIRIFHSGQLGGPQESLENLQTGTLELYAEDLSYYATLLPEALGVVTLMYFFDDNEHLRRYLTSEYFQRAHEEQLITKHGMRFISTEFAGDRGPYRVFVSTKPIFAPEDLQGVKMRLWPNDVIIQQWRHLGAVPTVLPWEEVYLALRQGTIDAVTGPLTTVAATKFAEVAPYISELRQFPQVWPFVVSEKVWQSLSADERQALVDAANEATAYYADLVRESADDAKQTMMKRAGAAFIQVDTEPFREKMEPLYEALIANGTIDQEAFDVANSLR